MLMQTPSSATIFLAADMEFLSRSLRTSSPYEDLPHTAPNAAATLRPIIPVPGMPTPIPFFRMFPLTSTLILKDDSAGEKPLTLLIMISIARAVARATATGSVHPKAGFTSLWTSPMISASLLVIIIKVISFSLLRKRSQMPYGTMIPFPTCRLWFQSENRGSPSCILCLR